LEVWEFYDGPVRFVDGMGWVVDPIIAEAGTALVKLMATDVWTGARDAVVAWWRRHHPEQAAEVGVDLARLHTDLADADEQTQQDLVGAWRTRLRQLVKDNPELGVELKRLVDEELAPLLAPADRAAVTAITQTATVKGNRNITIQAGRDVHPPASR
jgi:hypothetical protein